MNDDEVHSEMNPRIAQFVCRYPFGVCAAVVNDAVAFADAGYDVDVFLYHAVEPALVDLDHRRIHIHDLSFVDAGTWVSRTPLRIRHRARQLQTGLDAVTARVRHRLTPHNDYRTVIPQRAIDAAADVMQGRQYQCLLGVEPQGLVMASVLGDRFDVPVLYHSLEMYSVQRDENATVFERTLDALEKVLHRRAAATLIPEDKIPTLFQSNEVIGHTAFHLPVGLIGPPVTKRTRFFHDMFGFADTDRILLQFGQAKRSEEIAAAAARLPDHWQLVMHGFFNDEDCRRIRQADTAGRVSFSRDLVKLNDLPRLMTAADVGLVFYPDHVHYHFCGRSSEKMAKHMQCGTPVITVDFPSFQRVLDEYACGVCVQSPADIPQALDVIDQNYEQFRNGAWRAYTEQYELSRHFPPVMEFVARLGSGGESVERAREMERDPSGQATTVADDSHVPSGEVTC